jgi:hypothetical protein
VAEMSDRKESPLRKVAATPWRSRFQRSPIVFLAAALGGGLLIGKVTSGKSRSAPERTADGEASPHHTSPSWDWNDSVGVLKSVLIGIAITQAKKALFNPKPSQRATPAGAPEHPDSPAARADEASNSAMH